MMHTAECPACGEEISFEQRPKLAHPVLCPHCFMPAVVVAQEPLRLDWGMVGDGETIEGESPARRRDRTPKRAHRKGRKDGKDWDEEGEVEPWRQQRRRNQRRGTREKGRGGWDDED